MIFSVRPRLDRAVPVGIWEIQQGRAYKMRKCQCSSTGACRVFPAVPRQQVTLVVGPWAHGQWSSGAGITVLGDVEFFARTEEYYREAIEKPFLRKHLRTPGTAPPIPDLPAAIVFEVGANQW